MNSYWLGVLSSFLFFAIIFVGGLLYNYDDVGHYALGVFLAFCLGGLML